MVRQIRKVIALYLLLVLLALVCGSCTTHKLPAPDQTLLTQFRLAKDSYNLARDSIEQFAKQSAELGRTACATQPDSETCRYVKTFAILYRDKLQPASVVADQAFQVAATAERAYAAAVTPETRSDLVEKLNLLTVKVAEMVALFSVPAEGVPQ